MYRKLLTFDTQDIVLSRSGRKRRVRCLDNDETVCADIGCETVVASDDVLRCDSPGCNMVVSTSRTGITAQQLRVLCSTTLRVVGLSTVHPGIGFATTSVRRMPEVEWVARGGVYE